MSYYNFFDKYLKHGEGTAVCKMAGINDTQLSSWRRRDSMPRCDKLKDFLKALAIYKELNYKDLLIEYFRTI